MTVQFEITKKDVLLQVKTEAFVTGADQKEKFIFTCQMPDSYDTNQNWAITNGIKDYMSAYTLYKWYKRVAPDMADASELEIIRSDINHRINQRRKPVRRPVLPLNF